jgi:ABC-2 type transport system permease protein
MTAIDQDPVPPFHDARATAGTTHETRPFFWSVRRELWENRSVTIGPVIVAAVVLFATLIGMLGVPGKVRAVASGDAAPSSIIQPLGLAPAPIMLATFLIGFFFSLEALHGERRDRSILFFKSLPVSDRTTVLAKASVPLLVLPLIAYALSVIAVLTLLFFGTLVLTITGVGPARLWAEYPLFQAPIVMFYGLAVHALWFAPIHGWFLLVSSWARRLPLLWAVLPFVLAAMFERIAFGTSGIGSLVRYRFLGAMTEAFDRSKGGYYRLAELDPQRFLSAPGLWLGLIFAAACLAAAVRIRRTREPV